MFETNKIKLDVLKSEKIIGLINLLSFFVSEVLSSVTTFFS